MILGYFGIILFLTWEWVRFIKLKPTSISRRCGDALASHPPVCLVHICIVYGQITRGARKSSKT